MPDAAIRGEALFFSEKFECHHCHNNINMSDTIIHARAPHPEIAFNNTGLYNVDGKGGYPAQQHGHRRADGPRRGHGPLQGA